MRNVPDGRRTREAKLGFETVHVVRLDGRIHRAIQDNHVCRTQQSIFVDVESAEPVIEFPQC